MELTDEMFILVSGVFMGNGTKGRGGRQEARTRPVGAEVAEGDEPELDGLARWRLGVGVEFGCVLSRG